MKRMLIGITALALLLLAGSLAYKHFVTDQIMDRGGMENPNHTNGTEILDGNHTYVDNEALLHVITGTWESEDGRYGMTLQDDCRIQLTLDSEPVLESQLQFTYLQPGYVPGTEFSLDSCQLKDAHGAILGEVTSLFHEAGDGESGRIVMEVAGEDDSSGTVTFKKAAE